MKSFLAVSVGICLIGTGAALGSAATAASGASAKTAEAASPHVYVGRKLYKTTDDAKNLTTTARLVARTPAVPSGTYLVHGWVGLDINGPVNAFCWASVVHKQKGDLTRHNAVYDINAATGLASAQESRNGLAADNRQAALSDILTSVPAGSHIGVYCASFNAPTRDGSFRPSYLNAFVEAIPVSAVSTHTVK